MEWAFIDQDTKELLNQLSHEHFADADIAPNVDPDVWDKWLSDLPPKVACDLAVSGRSIDRNTLYDLAAAARRQDADPAAWSALFWNVFAWGGGHRMASRVLASFKENPDEVIRALHEAADFSYEGNCKEAFDSLHLAIKGWGPAFMTKFLAFTADRCRKGATPLIVDSRVCVAWRCLVDPSFNVDITAASYAEFCSQAAEVAASNSWKPEELEIRLFLFGRWVDTVEAWLRAENNLLRSIAGKRLPVVQDVFEEATKASRRT